MQRIKFHDVAPEGAQALRVAHDYLDHCSIPSLLVNLVYLRCSQINGCAYCVDLHTRDLRQDGMSIEKIVLVPVWRESHDVFSPREQAALAWAESLTWIATTRAPDDDYALAAAAFNERELADLTMAIALMNAYNRLGAGLRMPPRAAVEHLDH